jgi:ethanolaminephosphotransferase
MNSYITPKGEEAIRNFKYKGGDLSLSYQYLWSPLADFVVKFTPTTIAPNTITIIGLMAHIIGTIVLIS